MKLQDIKNKTVLVRVDFNVPIKDGKITDSSRIVASLPTIDLLHKNGCKTILASHLGRPNGFDSKLSFANLVPKLKEILKKEVLFCDLKDARKISDNMSSDSILMLENLRFSAAEEKNDPEFAKSLANLADIYVNDAFSVCHRNHASVVAITKFLPSLIGLACQKELDALNAVLDSKNSIAIVGGSKISTKLPLISSLLKKVQKVVLVGALANTVLKKQGFEIGKSLYEEIDLYIDLQNVFIPFDFVTSRSLKDQSYHIIDARQIPKDEMILDIGPASLIAIQNLLAGYKCVFWNGPLGAFEHKPFDKATKKIARRISDLTKFGMIKSIIGGGDTLCAVQEIMDDLQFSYASNAGGAFLKFLRDGKLVGISGIAEK